MSIASELARFFEASKTFTSLIPFWKTLNCFRFEETTHPWSILGSSLLVHALETDNKVERQFEIPFSVSNLQKDLPLEPIIPYYIQSNLFRPNLFNRPFPNNPQISQGIFSSVCKQLECLHFIHSQRSHLRKRAPERWLFGTSWTLNGILVNPHSLFLRLFFA